MESVQVLILYGVCVVFCLCRVCRVDRVKHLCGLHGGLVLKGRIQGYLDHKKQHPPRTLQ